MAKIWVSCLSYVSDQKVPFAVCVDQLSNDSNLISFPSYASFEHRTDIER